MPREKKNFKETDVEELQQVTSISKLLSKFIVFFFLILITPNKNFEKWLLDMFFIKNMCFVYIIYCAML